MFGKDINYQHHLCRRTDQMGIGRFFPLTLPYLSTQVLSTFLYKKNEVYEPLYISIIMLMKLTIKYDIKI